MAPTHEPNTLDLQASMSEVRLNSDSFKDIELPDKTPSGFNHLSATHEELLKHGLPPPPDRASFPDGYNQWEQIFSQPPTLVPSTVKPLSQSPASAPVLPILGRIQHGNYQSNTWSGAVNRDLPDGFKFRMSSASWTVARPCPPSSARTASGWDAGNFKASTWLGIDGDKTNNDVLRAGTAQRCVTTTDGEMQTVTFPWFGWHPSPPVEISGFTVSPGDLVHIFVGAFELGLNYWGSSVTRPVKRAFIFFCNRSTCTYFSAIVTAPTGVSLQGNSAEWVVECPDLQNGDSMSYLGSTFIYNCWAIAQNNSRRLGRIIKRDLRKATLTDITKDDGTTLSYAVKENNSVLGIFGETRPRATRIFSSATPRIVIYHQTSAPLSPLVYTPVATGKSVAVTHVNIAAFHINEDDDKNYWITLNNDPPDNSSFNNLWKEVKTLQTYGVKVLGMLGGAAKGTFIRLDSDFEKSYSTLKSVVDTYKLDGLDLDVEETMSQDGINRLIDRLKQDFHDSFIITLAPVASALNGGHNLSGFSYKTLEKDRGSKIAFYNAQFYNSYGSMKTTDDYDKIVASGFSSSKVVAGILTNSKYGGGYVEMKTLETVIPQLEASYPDFGGVAGWEYCNSDPEQQAPWDWALAMQEILNTTN